MITLDSEIEQLTFERDSALYEAQKYALLLEAALTELGALKTSNRKKLSPRDVQLIRRFGKTTGATRRELADAFEVNPATVTRILNGQYHKDK